MGSLVRQETLLVVIRWETNILCELVTRYLFWSALPSSPPTLHAWAGKKASVCACVRRKFSSACLCLGVWNVTDVRGTTIFYALTKGWRRWGVADSQALWIPNQTKGEKKDFAHSYKKVLVEKNPQGVQRDLCLIRQKHFYSLRNTLGVRGSCAVGWYQALKPAFLPMILFLFVTSIQRKSLCRTDTEVARPMS